MRTILRAVVVGMLVLVACSSDKEASPPTAVEKGLGRLSSGLEDGILTQDNPITGEQVGLRMSYRTDYDVNSWRITDSKTLAFSATLLGEAPSGATVLIEHVHVDVNLDARLGGFDGLPQDSMDDSLHTGAGEGFLVTAKYPYEDVFSIEGYSQSLISGWGYQVSGTGSTSISEQRLTEKNLREQGKVEANKFTFIYDVLIRYAPDEPFHKRVVVDEFLVPVGSL